MADTSTVVRVLQDRDIDIRWLKALRAGLVGVCPAVEAELVRSSSGPAGRRRLDQSLQSLFAWHPVPDDAWRFVARTQEALVAIGHHKGPSVVDLLVAATAEAHDLTVLHVDADFEAISRVTDVKSRRADRP